MIKAGVIAYSGGYVTLRCVVRDFSDTGSRLAVEGSVEAPDTFTLQVEIDGVEADCRVVWRRGKEIGVAFDGPIRQKEKRRSQVIHQWSNAPRPTLRRQPKGTV